MALKDRGQKPTRTPTFFLRLLPWPFVPKLADFGLARTREEGQTRTGQPLGTPGYMPPEQTTTQEAITPASDVYSLGAVLYCALTGRPPFQSSDPVETMRLVREEEPVSVRRLNPSVRRDLETICVHCLQKEPAAVMPRHRTWPTTCNGFLQGEPPQARPMSWLRKVWRRVKRRREITWAACATLIVTLAFLASFIIIRRPGTRSTRAGTPSVRFDFQMTVDSVKATAEGSWTKAASLNNEISINCERNWRKTSFAPTNSTCRNQRPIAASILLKRLSSEMNPRRQGGFCWIAQSLYEKVYSRDSGRNSSRCGLARILIRLSAIHENQRDYSRATTEYESALKELKELTENEPDNLDYKLYLAEAHHRGGELFILVNFTRKQKPPTRIP